ncbi:MAG: hypothetical protein E7321_06340 [Clostridiales bacterium]|nr:hypothetical protein [Clostridiales bacterium]
MRHTLLIESCAQGVLVVNGQFCGPMEREGQAFPVGRNAEVYVQMFPFGADKAPLTAAMILRDGQIARLEPQENAFALLWPDGVIQLELRMPGQSDAPVQETENAHGTLLRYLSLRLAGDPQAARLWLRAQDEANTPDLSAYHAAVPMRFAPPDAPERYDDRAGLVRRAAPNVATVDAALAITSPAGQGRRLLERIDILKT